MSRRRGSAVLLAWLAVVALALLQIARTHFSADLTAFLPASPDAEQRVLIEQLKSGLPSRTLFIGIEGGDGVAGPADRAAASRELGAALRASGLFEQVQNGQDAGWAAIGTWLFERRYALSPAVDAARFTPAGLADAIGDSLSLLGTPAGNALKPLLDRDPTGETQRIAEGLIPSRAPRTEGGVWAARSGARALLLVVTRAPGADLNAQAAAIQTIRTAFAPAAARGLTLQLSGTPLFSVDSRARIEHEVRWLIAVGVVVMSGLLLLAFASPLALAVAILPVASGVIAGIAAVSLGFGTVHGITLGFGSTLIGEAVDYAIYYLIQARAPGPAGASSAAGAKDGAGWRRWLVSGWPTVRLGLLTSVCGFAALAFSGFPGLAQLGVFSVAGLIGAALTTRLVLPVLMPDGASGVGLRRHLGRWAGRAVAWLPATRWAWLVLGVVALGVLWRHGDLWRADLSSLSPIPRAALDLDASLRADLSAGDGALVIVQGDSAEAALQAAEVATERLDKLVDSGVLAGLDSITRLLPSVATQARRLASLPDAATLRAALQTATANGPLRFERLAPFLTEVEAARQRPPDTPASVRDTAIAPLVNALLLDRGDGGWAALLRLQPAGDTLDEAAVTAALRGVPGARLLDVGSEITRLYGRYLNEAKAQALFGALGVLLIIAIALRSPRRVLRVCQPLVLALLLVLGGLAALRVPLGILHLVGLLLVVAVGSNYALFFDLLRDDVRSGSQPPDDDMLASLLLANATTVLSFGLIALSQIPALSAIGRVVAPGALLALLLAAAFAPRRAPQAV